MTLALPKDKIEKLGAVQRIDKKILKLQQSN